MTLRFLDIRIGQVAVEASSVSIDGQATGPFASIGAYPNFADLFATARTAEDGLGLPWPADKPRSNKFWKRYVTTRLRQDDEDSWPRIAWDTMCPLKVPATLPTIRLHPSDRRAYSEAYVWPTAFGFTWNNWLQGELSVADLANILDKIRNDKVVYLSPDGHRGVERLKTLVHGALDSLREAIWGKVPEGVRSDPITILSVVAAAGEAAAKSEEEIAEALQVLLDRLQGDWGERPRLLEGDREADSGHSVYAAKGLRVVWLPNSFLAKPGRLHRVGCFHRNLLLSTMQVEMLAATAEMFAAAKPRNASLPAGYVSFVERLEQQIDFFVSGWGYSAPFLSAQLERGPVKAARAALANT